MIITQGTTINLLLGISRLIKTYNRRNIQRKQSEEFGQREGLHRGHLLR